MMSVLNWIWTRGILSTFMAGVFVLLPIALTVAVISWVGTKLQVLGEPLERIGLVVGSSDPSEYRPEMATDLFKGMSKLQAGTAPRHPSGRRQPS